MPSVSFPQINTYASQFRPTDFSYLANLPNAFWQGQEVGRERQLRGELGKLDPNDPNYLQKATATLMKYDPKLGVNSALALSNQDLTNQYRTAVVGNAAENTKPDAQKLAEWWASVQGQQPEPMRVSPSQPSGVAGMSLQNAPAAVQKELMPLYEQKAMEAAGTGEGQRQSSRTGMEEAAPGVQDIINNLAATARDADPETFKNALGPLQGGGEAETLTGAATQFFPQTLGAIANYFDQGQKAGFLAGSGRNLHIKEPGELPGGYTTTLRSKINATQSSLIGILQRVQRVPGIGQQSDKELQQIVNQIGELNRSRDKADFYDRLSNVVTNMNATGIPVKMPEAGELGAVKPTPGKEFSERYANPPQETATAPAYDAAQPEPPQASQGSAGGIPGATSDPRAGYAKSISKLDGPAIARIRNWAAEAIAAGVPREVVMQRLKELGYGQ